MSAIWYYGIEKTLMAYFSKTTIRKKYLNNPLVVLLILFIIFGLIYGARNEVRNAVFRVASPIAVPLWNGASSINSFFGPLLQGYELARENEQLGSLVRQLASERNHFKEIDQENEILRDMLGMEKEREYELLPSRPVFFSHEGVMILDRGARDKVREGMPVITEEKILAGIVTNVYENFSQVTLPSHQSSTFDGLVLGQDLYGVVQGEGGGAIFDFIPPEATLERGSVVMTSRIGGVFPEGLLVGQIDEIRKVDVASFQQADLLLFFTPSRDTLLFIVEDFISLEEEREHNEL
jgi:rod shape-determining protein MreC